MPTTENQLLPDCSGFEKDIIDRQLKEKKKQEEYYNKRSKDLSVLNDGDEVWVKPHTLGERKWKKATVVAQRSEPRSYDIKMNTGEVLRRNRVDLRKSSESNDVSREQNGGEQNVDEEEHDQEGGKQLQCLK